MKTLHRRSDNVSLTAASVDGGKVELDQRCCLCGLWTCDHKDKKAFVVSNSLASQIGQPLAEERYGSNPRVLDAPRIRVVEETNAKVLIPPPKLIETDISNVWVNCNYCNAKINSKYLDRHYNVCIELRNSKTSTAIVPVKTNTPSSLHSSSTQSQSSFSPVHNKPTEIKPKVSSLEPYKFKAIETACAASSVSNDGRYSDITVVLWLKEKTSVNTTYHSGGSTSTTCKDWDRLSIHVVYDSLEEYYTSTIKLLKRSSYSSWDNEENVPDRICFDANELRSEIKRACLFFCISPKVAYKKFRKLFKSNLVIDYDADNKACIAQTENCVELFDRLKKTTPYTGYQGTSYYGD